MDNDAHDDIPPLAPRADHPPLRTQADLELFWRGLMGPLGFSQRMLWVLVIDHDDRPGPILQIDQLPSAPGEGDLDRMVDLLRHGVLGDASVAFLLTGPGRRPVSEDDLAWARGLAQVAGRAGMTDRPVHRANDSVLTVCSPDDLAA